MTKENSGLEGILSRFDGMNRRDLLKRSVVMGATIPAFASLLAACGGETMMTMTMAATIAMEDLPIRRRQRSDRFRPPR